MAKKKKQPSITTLHRQWSLAVRTRANFTCEICGRVKGKDCKKLDAHHVLSKERYPEYRFDLQAGVCLCFRCHKRLAHLDAIEFAEWLRANKPSQYLFAQQKILEKKKRGNDSQ